MAREKAAVEQWRPPAQPAKPPQVRLPINFPAPARRIYHGRASPRDTSVAAFVVEF